jgi:hypothetical protein
MTTALALLASTYLLGCKDPQAVADKKALEHRNRSAGQKARWRKARNTKVKGCGDEK